MNNYVCCGSLYKLPITSEWPDLMYQEQNLMIFEKLKPYCPSKSWKPCDSLSFTNKLCKILLSNPWLFKKIQTLLLSIGIVKCGFLREMGHPCKQIFVYITLPNYRSGELIF